MTKTRSDQRDASRSPVPAGLALVAALFSALPASGADPFAVWNRDFKAAIGKLQAGETAAAIRKLDALLEEYADLAGPGEGNEKNLGTILIYRALAMQQAGRVADAHWDWHVATSFLPDVERLDLSRFGEAGAALTAYAAERAGAGSDVLLDEDETEKLDAPALFVTPPKAVRKVKPRYPTAARQYQGEGALILQVVIDETGKVIRPRVVQKLPHPSLTYAALQAVRKWKFEPATLAGRPVKAFYDLTVHYNLR